jgi:tetratricopeptide (TPR) repeat protein
LRRELSDTGGIAASLETVGLVARVQGDSARAATLFEESLALRRELADARGIAASLYNLGLVAYDQGHYASSVALYLESLAMDRELGDRLGMAFCLEGLAQVASALGHAGESVERAAHLFSAAAALRGRIGAPIPSHERTHYDRQVAGVRTALGDTAFGSAWAEGQAMTLEQAISAALHVEMNPAGNVV